MCLLLPEMKGELRAVLGGRGLRDIEVTTWATVLSRKWEGWEEDSGRDRGT